MLRKGWAWLVTEGITNNGGRAVTDTYGHIPNYMQGLLGTLPSTDENDQFLFLRERLTKSLKSASDEPLITAARVYDAVLAVAQGLHMYLQEGNLLKPPSFPPNFCASELLQIWPQGELLFQYIKELKGVQGTLGHLTFTKYGFHTTIQYDIENLISQGFIKIGTWKLGNMSSELELSSKAVFPGNTLNPPVDSIYDLSNMSLRVVTVKDAPFVVDNPDYKPDDPNSLRYTGYCIDLLLRLQEMLSFRFTVSLRATYGRQDPQTGSWDGIVKELMEDKADLGLGAFTINFERQQVISFTKPFFDLGLTILIPRYNSAVQKDVFAFLSPFEPLLWAVILVALCVTSLVLVICSNCTPEGVQRRRLLKDHRKHCAIRQEPNVAPMGIFHALWLGFSSLVNQSIDPGRLLFPTRITLAVWWISTTVLVSAYTAKLASVMTVERSDKEVSSLEELVRDSKMEYGCAENSSVVDFFEKHEMALYREAFQKMKKMNSLVASFHEGIRKVRGSFNVPRGTSGRFAFIGDSPILTFATEQEPCNIETTGRLFGAQNYGLGLQKNSPYEKHFSLGILSLREEGFFETLYRRWFAGICSSPGKGSKATNNRQLDIWSMIGVFYCLLIGIGVAAVMVVVDWLRYMCWTTTMTCKVKKSKDPCQCTSKGTKRKQMALQNVKKEAGLTLYSDDFKIKGIRY
ncbi:glutamate receptor ionotropic, kainate 2-like [Tachypleus tridentatus]|uniref:glutamate receptor ionotropic, kainate 2-like n=1 Tax=Tachypleus tridentatus TaxID=6853 RepID=UPI003FD58FD3